MYRSLRYELLCINHLIRFSLIWMRFRVRANVVDVAGTTAQYNICLDSEWLGVIRLVRALCLYS